MPRAALVEAAEARAEAEAERGSDLLAAASSLRQKALDWLAKAAADDDRQSASRFIREARECLLMEARLRGEVDENPVINLMIAPVMIEMQAVILAALAGHPEARADVVFALGRMGGAPMIEHRP